MHTAKLALLLTVSLTALHVPDDPYRSLENLGSEATRSFIRTQDERTRRFVEALPGHDLLHRRLQEVAGQDAYSVPVQRGGRTFFLRRERTRTRLALYVEDAAGAERLLVDPETLGPEPLTLSGFVPSPDGRRVAYGLSRPGSNWARWKVRDVDGNRDLPDVLTGLRGPAPVAWTADGGSLFYAAAEEPPGRHRARRRGAGPDRLPSPARVPGLVRFQDRGEPRPGSLDLRARGHRRRPVPRARAASRHPDQRSRPVRRSGDAPAPR